MFSLLLSLALSQELRKIETPKIAGGVDVPKPLVKVEGKPPSTLTDKNASTILAKSSVRVICRQAGGRTGQGSGTVIRRDKDKFYVLTCSHVAEPAARYSQLVVVHGAKAFPAKLLVYCPVRDLALLECQGVTDAVPATVAKADSYVAGTPLFRCGYPKAGPRKVVRGRVLPVRAHAGGHPLVKLLTATPPSISGDSGGGVFRASDGQLIGVNYASDGHTSMTAARLESIWKLLNYSGVKFDGSTLPMPRSAVDSVDDINLASGMVCDVLNKTPTSLADVLALVKSFDVEVVSVSLGPTSTGRIRCKLKKSLSRDQYDRLVSDPAVLFIGSDRTSPKKEK